MLGAINNQDKYGESRVLLLTVRVHEKTASDHSGPILLSSSSTNPNHSLLIHQVPKFDGLSKLLRLKPQEGTFECWEVSQAPKFLGQSFCQYRTI